MTTLLDALFGPIDSTKYCWFFYVLSAFGLFFLVTAGMGLIWTLFGLSRNLKRRATVILPSIGMASGIVGYAMLYFTNRMLFQMCTSKGKCTHCAHQEGMGSGRGTPLTYEENKKNAAATMQKGVKNAQATMKTQQAARGGRPVVPPQQA